MCCSVVVVVVVLSVCVCVCMRAGCTLCVCMGVRTCECVGQSKVVYVFLAGRQLGGS